MKSLKNEINDKIPFSCDVDSQSIVNTSTTVSGIDYTAYGAYNSAVIAGKRLPEIEDCVMNDLWVMKFYAQNVIGGRLPDKMHNKMLLKAMEDPDNPAVKDYFLYVNATNVIGGRLCILSWKTQTND